MDIPYVPVTDMDLYERVANSCTDAVEGMLCAMHITLSETMNTTDAGPLIQGFVGGLVAWSLATGDTDVEKFRADLIRIYDCIAPQIAMSVAANAAGGFAEGSA